MWDKKQLKQWYKDGEISDTTYDDLLYALAEGEV